MHNVLLKPVLASEVIIGDFYADMTSGKVRKVVDMHIMPKSVTLIFRNKEGKESTVNIRKTNYVCILHAIRKG